MRRIYMGLIAVALTIVLWCGGFAAAAADQTTNADLIALFSSADLIGVRLQDGSVRVTCTIDPEMYPEMTDRIQYAWYVYEADHLDKPVEKTGYESTPVFTTVFDDPDKDYCIYAYIRDKETEEKNKALVGYWTTEAYMETCAESVQEFNYTFVSTEKTGPMTYRMTSSFDAGPEVQIYWGVYDYNDRSEKIDAQSYSYDRVFEYTLPEEGKRYAVKAFVRNT